MRRWLAALRRVNPGAPIRRILWWRLCQTLTWAAVTLAYRHRYWGIRNIPAEGPVLMVSNHQSYLDLIVVGCGIQHRHFHSMARHTLFRHRLFAWLIRALNAFEVDQSRGDLKAMRTAIDRLRQGHLLLVFPEGSRTPDGQVHPFQPGIMTLIRRAKPMVVPAAVEGCYDAWPIHGKGPRLSGRVAAQYGEAIAAERLIQLGPDKALQLLQRRVDDLRLDLRRRIRTASDGRFPAPGPGDEPTTAAASTAPTQAGALSSGAAP